MAAAGVHPKTAQEILRHSTIELTMGVYTHSLRGDEGWAVERLPGLDLPAESDATAETA